MSKVALKVENVSKLYRLGEVGTGTISHDLNRWWARVRGKEDPFALVGEVNDRTSKNNSKSGSVWALKDINIEVKQGEVLGIIGGNGAGKSTLLKLLSSITAPTTGAIKARGRIAALLEVGTGMHPEMTGRENVYLNGTILGMTKREVDSKFDEIVDFAGCAKYVDTPVKRYSSGMKVRLGFAVAAFLEPEILIVDEVLAVGDAEFQKKAIGKMQEVSTGGERAVLFVSHNMAAVRTLCTNAIALENGKVNYVGEVNDVISRYLQSKEGTYEIDLQERKDRTGSGKLKFTRAYITDWKDNTLSEVISGDPIQVVTEYKLSANIIPEKVIIALTIYNEYQEIVSSLVSDEMGIQLTHLQSIGKIVFKIPRLTLRGGRYSIKLLASYIDTQESNFLDNIFNAYILEVLPGDFWNSGKINRVASHMLMDSSIYSI